MDFCFPCIGLSQKYFWLRPMHGKQKSFFFSETIYILFTSISLALNLVSAICVLCVLRHTARNFTNLIRCPTNLQMNKLPEGACRSKLLPSQTCLTYCSVNFILFTQPFNSLKLTLNANAYCRSICFTRISFYLHLAVFKRLNPPATHRRLLNLQNVSPRKHKRKFAQMLLSTLLNLQSWISACLPSKPKELLPIFLVIVPSQFHSRQFSNLLPQLRFLAITFTGVLQRSTTSVYHFRYSVSLRKFTVRENNTIYIRCSSQKHQSFYTKPVIERAFFKPTGKIEMHSATETALPRDI